ncbi:ABC transporter substrate-binding protein [Nocardioides sp. 31GB23]|uniref:ABC transporter substrate-binding protein n=1 Tax=Nocardioides sp. 31GB23 TaxID=3156065 RepID=UPI0032AF8CB7
MKAYQSKILATAIAGVSALAMAGCGGGDDTASSGADGNYQVGVILPLTGPASLIGTDFESALKVFQDIDPDAQDVDIEYVVCDDETTPEGAANCARKLVQQDQVDMVFGPILGGTFEAAKAVLQAGPPTITSSPYVDPPAGSSVFTASGSAIDLDRTTLEYAKAKGYQKVAVLAASDTTGQTAVDNLNELNEEMDLDITVETMAPTDVDVSAQLNRLKNTDPDYVYVAASGAAAGVALKGLDLLGMSDIPTAMIWSNTTSSFFEAAQDFLPTDLEFAVAPSWLPDELEDAERAQQVKDFQAAFEKETGAAPSFVVQGVYDSFQLISSTLEEGGGDKQKMLDYLSGLTDFQGLNWTLSYSDENHRGSDTGNYVMMRYDGATGSWSLSDPA